MDIKINAKVEAKNGFSGHISRLILNPIKDELTHVVVKHQGEEYEVAVTHILSADEDIVELDCTVEYIHQQPNFIDMEYIREPRQHAGMVDAYGVFYQPYVTTETYTVKHEHIPLGEVSMTRNTPVFTREGRVGKIDELVIDPFNHHITHIVLREGHLWGQKDVVVEVKHINNIDGEGVHLNMSHSQVDELPTIPLRRYFGHKVWY